MRAMLGSKVPAPSTNVVRLHANFLNMITGIRDFCSRYCLVEIMHKKATTMNND